MKELVKKFIKEWWIPTVIALVIIIGTFAFGIIKEAIPKHHCPYCGNRVEVTDNYCSQCGEHLDTTWVYCPYYPPKEFKEHDK